MIGLPIRSPRRWVEAVDGRRRLPGVRGEAWFDYQYEGPPTCVHGGVIAVMFDEMLGAANIVAGNPGMTGTLTIRTASPRRCGPPCASRPASSSREGRKILTWGGIYHGDVLTAEAEGIFIEVGPERMVAIAEANPNSADPAMLAAMRAEAAAVAASMAGEPRPDGLDPDDRRPRDGRAPPGGVSRPSGLTVGQIFSRPSQ